ncbi:43626_t:CDS:2 [Gigaspora margarita]|uniref:43626_t:CDS:1 n=1 Tax=Gigaspora margarita TaxID=4874 RepID=A0ABM8VXG6_GIGMA|nr:43626_t:CDS:2 [Gigaspora margarita]
MSLIRKAAIEKALASDKAQEQKQVWPLIFEKLLAAHGSQYNFYSFLEEVGED